MRIASALPLNASEAAGRSAVLYPRQNHPTDGDNARTGASVLEFPSTANCGNKHVTGLLSSWKNIAAYLDRGVRTVQRWERTLGLPVHRLGTGKMAPVFAYEHEISGWLRQTSNGPEQPSASPRRSPTHLDSQPQRLRQFCNDLLHKVSELERAADKFTPDAQITDALLEIQKLVQTNLLDDRLERGRNLSAKPSANSGNKHASGFLSSWKNIAAYLDRGVRTVQRWERMLRLPVHRMSTGKLAPVFAFEHEIDRWLRESSKGPEQPLTSISTSRSQRDPQPEWLGQLYSDLLHKVLELERTAAADKFMPDAEVTGTLVEIQKLVQSNLLRDQFVSCRGLLVKSFPLRQQYS